MLMYNTSVCWVACCVASACCAGVLCAVLWARFLQVPALITLHDLRAHTTKMGLPLVAVCPTAETVAHLLQQKMSSELNKTIRLPTILDHVLKRKSPSQEQLEILEDILFENYLTLQEALMLVLPSCEKIVLNCRWQSVITPCEKLFDRELSEWGPCCVMRPENVKFNKARESYYEVTNNLQIAVQCTDQPARYGCEFFTRYDGEEWVEPTPLTPGYNYLAQMSFISVEDKDSDILIDDTCISTQGYTRRECLLKCREKFCRCADPMQRQDNVAKVLPICQVLQLKCLRTFKTYEKDTCKCLPPCKKMTTSMSLESSLMDAINETNDQIYTGLNATISSVLRINVRTSGSRIFVVNPTETWITLMCMYFSPFVNLKYRLKTSEYGCTYFRKCQLLADTCLNLIKTYTASLGGVFNMFLGVGLFSALEIMFLVFVRLPIAIRKSTEMDTATGH